MSLAGATEASSPYNRLTDAREPGWPAGGKVPLARASQDTLHMLLNKAGFYLAVCHTALSLAGESEA